MISLHDRAAFAVGEYAHKLCFLQEGRTRSNWCGAFLRAVRR